MALAYMRRRRVLVGRLLMGGSVGEPNEPGKVISGRVP